MTYKTIGAVAIAALLASPVFADGGPLPEPMPEPEAIPEPAPEPEPAPAPEPAGGFYVSLAGGAVWLPDMDIVTPVEEPLLIAPQSLTAEPQIIQIIPIQQGVVGDSVAEADSPGWAIVGAIGYEYGNGVRAELEVGYRRNDGTVFDAFEGFAQSDFSISALDVMGNVYYDFDLETFFRPYFGAGVGAAHVNLDLDTEGDDSAWSFAYQFIGGFSVPFPNTSFALFADYRYLATAGLEIDFDIGRDHDEYRSHTVLGGIRYHF